MENITSTSNAIVKNAASLSQKKFREETHLFLAEGEKAISGLYNSGFNIEKLFVKSDKISEYGYIDNNKICVVNEAVISKISTTKTACEAVAVFEQKKYELKTFYNKKRILLLENIKDAGNLGTIMRACKAFNTEGILLLGDTIDFYNPKVVRASVGCFDIPVLNINYEDLSNFKNHTIYSTALYENSTPLKQIKFKEPFIIAFGSEADGLSEKFLENKTVNINIETSTCVESLNLASAVSVCLYKIFTDII